MNKENTIFVNITFIDFFLNLYFCLFTYQFDKFTKITVLVHTYRNST